MKSDIRRCYVCGLPKSLQTEFYKNKHQKSGYRFECKQCCRLAVQKYRDNDREAIRERSRLLYKMMTELQKEEYVKKRAERNKTEAYKQVKKEYEHTPRAKFTRYKTDAKRYGRDFTLTYDTFKVLVEESCHYCGESGHGIDRVDNAKGYTIDNCVPCCILCNQMKSNIQLAHFIEHVSKIANRFRARKNYKDGALEERALIRKRFRENLQALQEGHARLKKLIDELEEAIK